MNFQMDFLIILILQVKYKTRMKLEKKRLKTSEADIYCKDRNAERLIEKRNSECIKQVGGTMWAANDINSEGCKGD